MPIHDYDGTVRHEIGKVYDYDGTANHQIGKVIDRDGTTNHLIYSAEEIFVSGGALQNGITFTKKASHWNASTTGVTMTEKADGGAYFGYNVSMLSGDIRGYDNVVYNYTRSGNTGQAGYFPIMFVCGTESQISGMRFTAFYKVNFNNCTQLVTAWNENKTFSGTVAIPDSVKNASEPQYLAWLIGSYNGTTATLVLNNISIT